MSTLNNRYPNIILYTEYNDRLVVREKICLPIPQKEIILRKPIGLLDIDLEPPGRVEEDERGNVMIILSEKSNVVKINYELWDKPPLYSRWIIAPRTCYTIDATIQTPLPLKSLINAEEYGFHVWGKYGYSKWISSIPRREYILSIDKYFIMDEQTSIIASPDEEVLDELKIQVEQAYMKTKEIIPWKKPLIAYNVNIGTFVSSYTVFTNKFSWKNIVELLAKSVIINTTGIPLEKKLLESIRVLSGEKENIMIEEKNPYLGLIKLYGKDFLLKMFDIIISSCPNDFNSILENIFNGSIDVLISLLERDDVKISIEDSSIACIKGPCILILEKEGIEYLKAILEEGSLLKVSKDHIDKSIIRLL